MDYTTLTTSAVVFSLCSGFGTLGIGLLGYGMAITFTFVWTLATTAGFQSNFKYAIFLQSIGLLAILPYIMVKARVIRLADLRVLLWSLPPSIALGFVGTAAGKRMNMTIVLLVSGVCLIVVAVLELVTHRALLAHLFCRLSGKSDGLATKKDEYGAESAIQGDYRVLGALGDGAFGSVSLAEHRISGERVALKAIDKSKFGPEILKMQIAEAELQSGLSHPNIVEISAILGKNTEALRLYIVAEYADGGDLHSALVGRGRFSEARARHCFGQLLQAVSYLHAKGIAHRDIKPENVLLFEGREEDEVAKLSDFGLAAKGSEFTQVCGTWSYMAPEVIRVEQSKIPYGLSCDMWSMGVLLHVLLVGYTPFRPAESSQNMNYGCDGEETARALEEGIKEAVCGGSVEWNEEDWSVISQEARNLVSKCLSAQPHARPTAEEALQHPWMLKTEGPRSCVLEENLEKVFFVVGSQRSGSNWLRTMLDSREDLAGPHPPHMLRDFIPILPKFGDLTQAENLRILVDHMCTFTETNQVPWTDKRGRSLQFPRAKVFSHCLASLESLRKRRVAGGDPKPLSDGLYAIAVFDAIMNTFSEANGKRTWVCKSPGYHRYHEMLLEYYGRDRLRYIYLVRDPRDVALSFMNVALGDSHYHPIVTKWVALQKDALPILEGEPDLMMMIKYEEMLIDKDDAMERVYQWIGPRRFGGLRREASVMCMQGTGEVVGGANTGKAAKEAMHLSKRWKNLHRGPSFVNEQKGKWRSRISTEDLQIIETVAHDVMGKLGYDTHLVGKSTAPTVFSEEDLRLFADLNKKGIEKMMQELKEEDPDDLQRRQRQSSVLRLEPVLLGPWNEREDATMEGTRCPITNPRSKLTSSLWVAEVPVPPARCPHVAGVTARVAYAQVAGVYPGDPARLNEDSVRCFRASGEENLVWLSVCDGHGKSGALSSQYAAARIPQLLFGGPEDVDKEEVLGEMEEGPAPGSLVRLATSLRARFDRTLWEDSFLQTHRDLVKRPEINTRLSGSTATCALLDETTGRLIVASVGDSVCFMGTVLGEQGLQAKILVQEHVPTVPEERRRIEAAGGLVLTVDQMNHRLAGKEAFRGAHNPSPPSGYPGVEAPTPIAGASASASATAPLRIWSARNNEKFPGCAFTRSLGDEVAHGLGVIARPEVVEYELRKGDRVLVIASDGLTTYMKAQEAVKIIEASPNPAQAAAALVTEASARWEASGSEYTDDISIIVAFLSRGTEGIDDGVTFQEQQQERESTAEQLHSVRERLCSLAPMTSFERVVTFIVGASSGFLGGLCGLAGPPIILYFLHPPTSVRLNKASQRATGAGITLTNAVVRGLTYAVHGIPATQGETLGVDILCTLMSAFIGVIVGNELFRLMKDSREVLRVIFAVLLLIGGLSLVI